MQNQNSINEDNPNVLYEVLLEEYQALNLLTLSEDEKQKIKSEEKEIRKIEGEIEKIEDEIKRRFSDRTECTEKLQEHFIAKSKKTYKILEDIRRKIHAKKDDNQPAALCLSGGGIRSATFCLGVLQGLAKNDLLEKFDYLSTVSGGGYIGSWLSAWLYREGNMDKVQSALSRSGGYPYLFGMEDFQINFTDEHPEQLKKELQKLQIALDANDDFFFHQKKHDLSGRLSKIISDWNQNLDEKNLIELKRNLRKFGQDLCEELNRVILHEQCESTNLKSEIIKKLKENTTQKRMKIKRELFDNRLTEVVYPLDDFEHIEPPEITYLRTYSNFMSPRTGLFSIDTWTIVATYLRNLLLNWMVFLPLVAMFLMLPRLFPAFLNSQFKSFSDCFFGISVIAGIIAVTNIIAMRPTLNKFSWIGQHYKISGVGTIISAETKVRRWCLLPLLVTTFAIVSCWVWTVESTDGNQLTTPFVTGNFFRTERLIDFVLFYELLFLGGFIIAHSIIKINKIRKKNKDNSADTNDTNGYESQTYIVREFLVSAASGVLGGASLYLFANLLQKATLVIRDCFPNQYFCSFADKSTIYACFAPPLFLITVLLSTGFFVGIAGKIYDDIDREWLARFGAWLLVVIIVWSVLSIAVLIAPELFKPSNLKLDTMMSDSATILLGVIGSISGLITLVLGFSRKSPAIEQKENRILTSILLKIAPQIAAPIFGLFLILFISRSTSLLINYVYRMLEQMSVVSPRSPQNEIFYLVFWIAAFGILGSLMGYFININKFSLHAMYRERLIRAYLGASRTDNRLKSANSFTDLDEKDNVEMYKLGVQKPFHVVNMTLNLGKANNLRWQDRKAASFTATSLYCGSSNMGDESGNYRQSQYYGCNKTKKQAITLGTVAAVSGAAVSPNMGYYSMSPAVSFLMALFNVRLGWWLGNPGKRGSKTYKRSAPNFSPGLLYDEAFGDTSDTNPYIYLSDGGHFDNLGLYEMVLRRCHFIVACDAGADSKFGFFDLGTAIHKIRVDMGIPIEFEAGAPVQGRNCAIARIKYKAIDGENAEDGFLIYIKPTLDGDEPIDVVNYKNINPDFPHETTGDEFYSETQFESYRSLGFHMINSICSVGGKAVCANISSFKENAENYLNKRKP